jgi:hypothetical protein
MGSVPYRVKHLESVISICLLVVLFLIGAGVFIKQFNYNANQHGIQQLGVSLISIGAGLAPAGFGMLSKVEVYNADNLYEKINGKAPLYIESGFKELSTQRFVKTGDPNLWMELYVYDMGNIKNAFSVYSVQKRAESEAFPSMQLGTPQSGNSFAYKTSNALYFVHGKYYIEIVGSSESRELSKAIEETSQKLKSNLAAGANASIAELAFFPQENLVPDSFKLYLVSTFGCEKLTDVFTARYKSGEKTITAFIGKRADSKEAEAMAESYRKFLIENGATIKSTTNKTIEGKVVDFYGTTEIVFTVGPFVAGIHEAENQERAEKIAEILIGKLKSLNNE